jgi:predicted LPLAT superfamily acyltransferase
MAQWDGKSKGTVFGYKIFVFFIKKVGIKSAYFILYFAATYYFLFLKSSNRATFYYFRRRLGYSDFKSRRMVFNSYYTFGQTIIDKISISAGMRDRFTYEFDGIESIKKLLAENKGGVMISAHIGNFEIAEHFFGEIDVDFRINLVTSDLERSDIKDYLDRISKKSTVRFITIGENLSHIFEINAALSRNELVCFTGDRYLQGTKSLSTELLGETANFPSGPFLISSRLKVPVIFVYVMKEPNLHYHLYAREAEVKHRDEKALLEAYAQSVEGMLNKYPLQWFNYFDFWEKLGKDPKS